MLLDVLVGTGWLLKLDAPLLTTEGRGELSAGVVRRYA